MAELFDKIMQDGRVSFVPRSNKTRRFWDKYNAKIAGSSNAQKETVTWQPATEEETKAYYAQLEAKPVQTIPVQNNELEALKQQLAEQQKLITELLVRALPQSSVGPAQVAGNETGEESKEKGKPGPKPKNNTNGENKETINA